MRFKLNKLPLEKAASLRRVPAPVYLLMTRNQKFVSLKRPFDFFTPQEVSKLKHSDNLYYSNFFDRLEPFRQAARTVKATMSWSAPSFGTLEPAGYEISDEILKTIAPLWAPITPEDPNVIGIESYFAVVFTNELCEPLPSDRLLQARESDVDRYELGILRAGVSVFFALHLGFIDLDILNQLRYRVFVETVNLASISALIPYSRELEELKKAVETVIHNSEIETISSEQFKYSLNRANQKMKGRLNRIKREISGSAQTFISAYGTEGVFDDTRDGPPTLVEANG